MSALLNNRRMSDKMNTFWRILPWMPFIFTVALRFIALQAFADSPFFLPIGGDRGLYHGAAIAVAAGNPAAEVFTFLPLYPHLLAGLYFLIGGPNLAATAIAHALFDGFTAMMLFHAASRRYNRATGLLAGFGFAFLNVAATYSLVSMPVSIGLFWTMLIITLSDSWKQDLTPGKASAFGLALGVGGQILAAFWLMIIPLAIRAAIISKSETMTKRVLLGILIIICGYACILPTLAHNVLRGGEWVPVTAHGGLNLFIGNNAAAKGYGVALPGARLSAQEMTADAQAIASGAVGTRLTIAQADRFWRNAAIDFWMKHPGMGVALLARKIHRILSIKDFDDTGLCRLLSSSSGWHSSFLGFGVVWILTCLGMPWRHSKLGNSTLWIMGMSFAAGILMTFVTARYRIPLAVLMLPAAGGTLAQLPGKLLSLRRKKWKITDSPKNRPIIALKCAFAIAGIGIALAPHPLPDTELTDDLNRSAHFLQHGDAVAAWNTAVRTAGRHPSSADALFALGNACIARNDFEAAADAYSRVAEISPIRADAMFNAAYAFRELRRTGDAINMLFQAVEADPGHIKAWFVLAEILRDSGDAEGARLAINKAAEIAGSEHPQIVEFLNENR